MDDVFQVEDIKEKSIELMVKSIEKINSSSMDTVKNDLINNIRGIHEKYKKRMELLRWQMAQIQGEKEAYRLKNIELKQKLHDLELENQRLLSLSQNDGLTGVPNRRRLDEYLSIEWMRERREASYLSLLIIDIDYFKEYNDHYGHLEGDQCLIQVANALKGTLKRPGDLLARYGGDEFMAVLPNTDSIGALLMAEEMRREIEKLEIIHQYSSISNVVSITVGVATVLPSGHTSVEDLVHMADSALYQAKKKGRNQIVSLT
ncbi:diguanylate cyclase (GGDEF)-like protein [Anaerosolibacter carboniphilus]|uniref:Diguanylate cyclase (GGDEF)-like protein n=1 Tax=Anaerosolibacter carboniphilus TaxID=1417629 RepID=A0A841KRQ0_9FIRM|nr:diguanylate cyclase [Anaerosolibacter carboniphilus]MBB6216236.1 diguanylate cyclase (GGDEF)-like protein [Anaerosolibacter carboniphilus]